MFVRTTISQIVVLLGASPEAFWTTSKKAPQGAFVTIASTIVVVFGLF